MSINRGKSDFDPVALHRKYLEERDKRLRPNGDTQYVKVAGNFSHYLDDPYADGSSARTSCTKHVEVAIVGGGFAGMLTAAGLVRAGVNDFLVIDKASDFGGTWYWNRYPGCACDVESYIYMPLLEESGYMPTEKYAKASEIWEHCRRLGRHFDLYRRALFKTLVTRTRWDEKSGRWNIETDQRDSITAKFICFGPGPVNRPKLPGIPGIESFQGHSFHTCRWDYNYTGGSNEGGLSKLSDKTVGIIGTGATAIQCVPHLANSAKKLFVFQRTPSSVDIRGNRATDEQWALALSPGWQLERMKNFERMTTGYPADVDLVHDGWTDIGRNLMVMKADNEDGVERSHEELMQLADFAKMEEIRKRVDKIVRRHDTAEALKPYYNLFCKRPCFSDEYLQAFNRPNVTLVDTKGKGVEAVRPRGVIANGISYDLDCLIYATGFEQNVPVYQSGGFDVIGKGGLSLEEKWRDGIRSLHGMFTCDFPNMIIVGGIRHAGGGFNVSYILTEQCRHAAAIIAACISKSADRFEVTAEAEDRWTSTIREKAISRDKFVRECTPGYYNNEGNIEKEPLFTSLYGGGSIEYFSVIEQWRAEDINRDIKFTIATA